MNPFRLANRRPKKLACISDESTAPAGFVRMADSPSFRQSGLTGEMNPLPILVDRVKVCVVARSFFSRGEKLRAASLLSWARVIRAAGRLFFPWGGKRRSAAFLLRGEAAAPCNPTVVFSTEKRPAAFFRGDWVMGVAGRLLQWVCSGLPHRFSFEWAFSQSSNLAGKRGRSLPGFFFFFSSL